jgi:hypothetical protein
MERFPVELLYVLGFIAIVLFNFFAQRAARRRQQQEGAQAEAAPKSPPQDEIAEDVWGRTATAPAPAPALVPVVRAASPPPLRTESSAPRRLHPARALLKDKRDLRRAVVLMIVLGPCRAQESREL